MTYTLSNDPHIIIRDEDQAHIPDDPNNTDYMEYMEWLSAGNVPNSPPIEIDPRMWNEKNG